MRDVDLLAQKIDSLVDVTTRTSDSVSELTKAVTTLLIQTSHFEQLRVEDNRRMDKMDAALETLRKECRDEQANIYKLIGIMASKVDKALPVIAIMTVVITGISVAALVGK